MKMKRRILSVLVCLVLLALAAVTVFATEEVEYTGNVEGAYVQLGLVDTKIELADKIKSIDNATEYLATVDPESEGYAELAEAYDLKEIELAELQLTAGAALPTASERHTAVDELAKFLAAHPFEDKRGEGERFEDKLAAEITAIAETYLADSRAASTGADKHEPLDKIMILDASFGIKSSELYNKEAIELANFECAKVYLDEINVNAGTAKFGAALRRLNGFVKDHTFPSTLEGYLPYSASYSSKTNAFNTAYAKAKAEAQTGAHLSDWDKKPVIDLSFPSVGGVIDRNTGNMVASYPSGSSASSSFIGIDSGKDGNNGYYTVKYEIPRVNFRTDANITAAIAGSFVFECDFTTFGMLPNDGQPGKLIWFENGSFSVNGSSWSPVYLSINSNGDIVKGTDSKAVLVEGAVTPGEWVRIGIVGDHATDNVKIYVDYELVAEYSLAHSKLGYTQDFGRIRIGCNPEIAGGEFSLDNVSLYQGNAPRDLDYYDKLTDDERFILYASQIGNTKLSRAARYDYYSSASGLVRNYYDGETYLTTNAALRSAVDAVLEFDSAKFFSEMADENLSKLKEIEAKIKSFGRSETSYNDRTFFLGKADAFISSTSGAITSGPDYSAITTYLGQVRNQLAEEDLINQFIIYVSDFFVATDLPGMEECYKNAKDLYSKVDLSLTESSGFPKFKAAYENYQVMAEQLADNRVIDNSKMLLACIQFIIDYDTPEEWEANYDYLINYVTMASDIINSGLYDPYYKNSEELIARFIPMKDYFNVRVQEKHIEHISSELARHDSLDISRYFEKYGICIKLREYINTQKIDYEIEELAALVAKVEANIETLLAERGEYEELLNANTLVFIEKCNGLLGSIGYSDMKKLCEEARPYFYTMNVNDASAQDAVSIYIARCTEIDLIEAHAKAFIDRVNYLSTPDIDLPAAIISAAGYLSGLDSEVEGVSEAIEQLEKVCEEYDASVSAANADLAQAANVASSAVNVKNYGGLITAVLRAIFG